MNILDVANATDDDELWDALSAHPDYSEENTDIVEHGDGMYFADKSGTVYRWHPESEVWAEHGSIDDYR